MLGDMETDVSHKRTQSRKRSPNFSIEAQEREKRIKQKNTLEGINGKSLREPIAPFAVCKVSECATKNSS